MARGIRSLEDIEKEVAYQSGYLLTGLNFSKRDDGWLMIVKVQSKKSGHLVAFIHALTTDDCLDVLWSALTSNDIHLKWKPDQYKK